MPAPRGPVSVGIVVPTLNEEDALPILLADLRALSLRSEILVVDGGSTDGTLGAAIGAGARVLRSGAGRGRQMNEGAAALGTPWLLFLHADSRLPPETILALEHWLQNPSPTEAAHFVFRLDRRGVGWRLIEGGQRVRERLTGLAYGDQGLLLSRRRFEEIGGIPEIPIMEDVAAIHRLRRGRGMDRIEAPVVTSARRYLDEGPILAVVRNAMLLTLYSLGISPTRLARWYRPRLDPTKTRASLARAR